MRKIKFTYENNGKQEERIAVLTDELSHPIPHPDNQADGVVDGVAEELGIWSIYFDNNEIEADFVCEIDDDGDELKTLTPVELWLWNQKGKIVPFTVKEI